MKEYNNGEEYKNAYSRENYHDEITLEKHYELINNDAYRKISYLAHNIKIDKNWNYEGGDLVAQLLTELPEWQAANITLEIIENGTMSYFLLAKG